MSERGVRRLSKRCGVVLERVLVRGGCEHWALFRTPDDQHGSVLLVPPYSTHFDGPFSNQHWSSCTIDAPAEYLDPADER
jgi:hypothetical protein